MNPTDKSELLSFICNELLSNKAVVRQIDYNVEAIGKAKKEKWESEATLKRLKIIQVKKSRSQIILNNSSNHNHNNSSVNIIDGNNVENHEDTNDNDSKLDEIMSEISVDEGRTTPGKKRPSASASKKKQPASKKKKMDPTDEGDLDESTNISEVKNFLLEILILKTHSIMAKQ